MITLVTGASGLIGHSLKTKLMSDGYDIYCPGHLQLDLTQFHAVKTYLKDRPNIDCVVHCATSAPAFWEDTAAWGRKIDKDILMMSNLLRFSPRLIFLTSGSIYGSQPLTYVKEDEISSGTERDETGWPKFVISALAAQFENTLELRPFGVYGPREPERRFPSYCIKQVINRSPIVIKQNRPMSYIYVDDLACIIEHFLENPTKHKAINVANFSHITLAEIAYKCMRIIGTEVPLVIEGNGPDYIANTERLQEEFPMWSETPWSQGLAQLYEYIKDMQEI